MLALELQLRVLKHTYTVQGVDPDLSKKLKLDPWIWMLVSLMTNSIQK